MMVSLCTLMMIFRFFGENCLKLELSTFVHEMLIEHKEEDIK